MTYEVLATNRGYDLAYIKAEGESPTVIFLAGYRSDMEGTKAVYLEEQCRMRGQGFIRFDYEGHGHSGGDFAKGTLSLWTEDTLDVIDHLTQGPLVLVGSSMGGWISLLCAIQRPERVGALIGLAAAPDFTLEIEARLTNEHRQSLKDQGYFEEPNDYSDEPYMFTRALLEDGRKNCLLGGSINLDIPVRLIQGMWDTDVEWQKAYRIKNAITGGNTEVFLVEEGDHRLSRPEDLRLIDRTVVELSSGF